MAQLKAWPHLSVLQKELLYESPLCVSTSALQELVYNTGLARAGQNMLPYRGGKGWAILRKKTDKTIGIHSLYGNLSQERWKELNSNKELVQSKWGLGKVFTWQNQSLKLRKLLGLLLGLIVRGSGKGYFIRSQKVIWF